MLIGLYNHLLIMSIVAGCLCLLLKVFSTATMRCFTASWHYYTYITVSLFLIFPYHKLLAFLFLLFRQKTEDGLILPALPAIMRIPIYAGNDVVAAMEKTAFPFVLLPYLSLAGTVLFTAVMITQNYKLHRRILDVCQLTNEEKTLDVLARCKEKIGISRHISVYVSPYTGTPFLYGALKPRVILPTGTFTEEELEHVFCHELTHWKRHDAWLQFLMLLINAIHWFNPFAYIARRDVDRFCELSCDERIVATMDPEERRRYCELLLSVLRYAAVQDAKFYSALSDKKQIKRRIDMILKSGNWKNRKWIRLLAVIMTAALLLAGGFAAFAATECLTKNTDGVVLIDTDSIIFSEIATERIYLADENVNLLEIKDFVLFEGANSSIFAFKANGDLGAGKSFSYDEQYLAAGQKVAIHAHWTPAKSDIMIGIKSSDGTVSAKMVSGGTGSVTLQIKASDYYYIYIGDSSSLDVKFKLSYIVN